MERGAWSVERGVGGVGRGAWGVERRVWSVEREKSGSGTRIVLLELPFLGLIRTFYGSSVQAMDTQLGARHRRWTPTIHRGKPTGPTPQAGSALSGEIPALAIFPG